MQVVCWLVAVVVVLCLSGGCALAGGGDVQVWMGLERTGEDIQSDLQELSAHKDTIASVSFEQYNLGADSTLLRANLSAVGPVLKPDFHTFPMISTYNDTAPHRRPTDIVHCRELFANPAPFVATALDILEKQGFTGMNVDFEASGGSADDAPHYASFLDYFASHLHDRGFKLSVDIASWDAMWNWDLIAKTAVDQVITMDTYAGNFDTFSQRLDLAVSTFGVDRLVVGLMTVNPNTNLPFSEDEIRERFQALQEQGVKHISLWQMPVPENWWPFLEAFVA